jgi:carbonic anhydrase
MTQRRLLSTTTFSLVLLCMLFIACNQPGAGKTENSETTATEASKTEARGEYKDIPYPNTPDEAIKRIREGNSRFVNDEALHPNRNDERKILQAQKQTPFVAIMGCSDSRVPSEIIFDQGLGDIFVVRTAGQVMADASVGSLEFATAVLGVKAIVVLGHEKCGAVKGALGKDPLPGKIEYLVQQIRPAIQPYLGDQSKLEEAAHKNVEYQVKKIKEMNPILKKYIDEGKIKVIGAMYNLSTGKVDFFDETGAEVTSK